MASMGKRSPVATSVHEDGLANANHVDDPSLKRGGQELYPNVNSCDVILNQQ
jgi:hypothetical protein